MSSIEPTPEQLRAFLADPGDGIPIVMLNLLRYRERAEYDADADAAPCSGREAYQRYAAGVTPILADVGATVVFLGNVRQVLIGPEREPWDDAILVRYPSRAAFAGMVSSAAYQAIAPHRTAALADSRLIVTVGGGAF